MASADEPTLPPSVRKSYVLDGEKVVVAIHQHPVVVAEPVATALAILVLVVVVDATITARAAAVVDVLWWVWFVALARAVLLVVDWRRQWVIATDKRIMRTYGFVVRKVAMMPLGKVTDMSYHRSIMGRLLGWGTFVMESAGQQQALSEIRFVPQPDHNYRALCAQIFGVADRERVTEVDEDVQDSQWDEDEIDELVEEEQGAAVQVEPGPVRLQRVEPGIARPRRAGQRRPGARAPRDGHDTADLPVLPSSERAGRRGVEDDEARDLLSSWERFARRYDEVPEHAPEDGTTIYRSGGDTLSS